jgi:RNA polymerase sigma-70 factor (ECF subfamily)
VVQAVRVPGPERDEVGDGAVFARLYPSLRRFAAVTSGADDDPDDLVQEAVARTLRHHALCDLADPAAYLRRAILNLAANRRRGFLRWRAAATRLVTADQGQAPVYTSDLADLLALPPQARALLYLVEVEGCSYAEAGAVLGISAEAARARAMRARRQLRAELEGGD